LKIVDKIIILVYFYVYGGNMDIHEKLIEWEKKEGKKLFQKMGISQNAIIVDFGSGYGEYSISASKYLKDGKVFAIDCDKKSIKILQNKIDNYGIKNIEIIENKKELIIPLKYNFADVVLYYDMIHGNDLQTKLPVRFGMYTEAKRVLKKNGILSIAPFSECNKMKDKNGKYKNYSKEKIIEEIKEYEFTYISEIEGAIHFEKSRSPYQWKKFNNNMQFEDIEKGPIWNFIKN
jgi:ubiquinone/menaquinone biosynthesis C-methylase UbiE